MSGKQTSPWAYVGMGCALAAALLVAGGVTVGYFAYHWGKQLQADMSDPRAREARTLEVLGGTRLPDGYYSMMGMSIPFVLDMAMLTDQPPDGASRPRRFGQRGFIYLKYLRTAAADAELRDYFEGRTDDDSVLQRHRINVRVHAKETIRRGRLDMSGYSLLYLAQRGRLETRGADHDGIQTLMLFACPQDQRMRIAFWFGPDPDPKAPVAAARLAGTPADEGAIRDFVGHFAPCGT